MLVIKKILEYITFAGKFSLKLIIKVFKLKKKQL